MATTIVATTSANIAAMNANSAASRANKAAKTLECKGVLLNYNSNSASVEQMQEYSECVQYLYPEQKKVDVSVTKIGIGSMLVAMIIGLCVMYYSKYKSGRRWDIDEHIMYPVMVMFTSIAVLFVLVLIVGMVCFVFS